LRLGNRERRRSGSPPAEAACGFALSAIPYPLSTTNASLPSTCRCGTAKRANFLVGQVGRSVVVPKQIAPPPVCATWSLRTTIELPSISAAAGTNFSSAPATVKSTSGLPSAAISPPPTVRIEGESCCPRWPSTYRSGRRRRCRGHRRSPTPRGPAASPRPACSSDGCSSRR